MTIKLAAPAGSLWLFTCREALAVNKSRHGVPVSLSPSSSAPSDPAFAELWVNKSQSMQLGRALSASKRSAGPQQGPRPGTRLHTIDFHARLGSTFSRSAPSADCVPWPVTQTRLMRQRGVSTRGGLSPQSPTINEGRPRERAGR
ncbi:hypothetical protein BC834DRAFT_401228 [Gloeopeniophorella convolvens]|nr:hypothetical protein BC834DRAFT_401228 [Gloeopeniophorella convolvens]